MALKTTPDKDKEEEESASAIQDAPEQDEVGAEATSVEDDGRAVKAKVPRRTPKPPNQQPQLEESQPHAADAMISSLFNKDTGAGQGHGQGGKGKGGRGTGGHKGISASASSKAQKEISKSDLVCTEAGQLLQAFDDASAIFTITEKKVDDLLQKVKGGDP